MAITTTADIDELIPMIYETARKTMIETPVMRNNVKSFDISKKAGNTITLPKWGTVVAESLTQGVDLDNPQSLGTTGITLTVSEAGAQTVVTDDEIEDASEDVIRRHGEILGDAMATKDDKDGLALFSGLSDGIGAADKALSLAMFTAAQTRLRGRQVTKDLRLVCHPYQYHDFAMAIIANSAYGTLRPAGDEIGKRFRASEFLGVNIFEDANIALTGDAGAEAAVAAMFAEDTFGRVTKRGLRIEKERDASLRAWELNATTRYSYGEVEDTHGVKITTKSVAPTGA